jgi:hypothetical protein
VIRVLALLFASGGLASCAGLAIPPPAVTTSSAPPTTAALPAGTYSSVNFQPAVTFTVPDGWVLSQDAARYLALQPVANDALGLYLFRDPSAASQDTSCAAAPEAGVGGTSAELVAWIAQRPGLAVSTPALATIAGVPGLTVDVSLRPDWTQSCPFANGVPAVPLFNSPNVDHWVVVGSERLRLYLLDLAGGGTLVVDVDAFNGDQFPDLTSMSGGVLRSLKLAAPTASSPASAPAGSPAPASGSVPPSGSVPASGSAPASAPASASTAP